MKNCQLKYIFCFTSEQKPSTSDLLDLGRMNMEGIITKGETKYICLLISLLLGNRRISKFVSTSFIRFKFHPAFFEEDYSRFL